MFLTSSLIHAVIVVVAAAAGFEVTISNIDEFIDFSKGVNSGTSYNGTIILLDSDINFEGVKFNPIGNIIDNYRNTFAGTFDGQGHTISNLVIDSSSSSGLFGYSNGMTIQNLILDGTCSFTITSIITTKTSYTIGSLVTQCIANNGPCNILNSVNMASVTYDGNTNINNVYIGGFTGYFSNNNNYISTVKNCANYGTVTLSGTAGNQSYIGGIAGFTYSARIQNCYNYGIIVHTGKSYITYVGGLTGTDNYCSFENCVNVGLIKMSGYSSAKYVGTLVGEHGVQATISNCYWNENIEYDAYGSKLLVSKDLVNCAKFDNDFVLNQTVSTLLYSGTSLINALNGLAIFSSNGYAEWLLNKKKVAVKFTVNNAYSFYEESQLILLPNLLSGDSKMFDGWYTDSACTTPLPILGDDTYTELYCWFE